MKVDKELERIKGELSSYFPTLSKTVDSILKQEVSSYPIFVIHQQLVEIGVPIIKGESEDEKWSVNASTLEEFVAKNLIQKDKVEGFRSIYKSPEKYFCLFILADFGAKFIFLPRFEMQE